MSLENTVTAQLGSFPYENEQQLAPFQDGIEKKVFGKNNNQVSVSFSLLCFSFVFFFFLFFVVVVVWLKQCPEFLRLWVVQLYVSLNSLLLVSMSYQPFSLVTQGYCTENSLVPTLGTSAFNMSLKW